MKEQATGKGPETELFLALTPKMFTIVATGKPIYPNILEDIRIEPLL